MEAGKLKCIELEEIMIGNYYSNSLANEWYHQITPSDYMNIYVNGSAGWYAIPLTEKWLQDFGFEFSHKSIGFEGEEIYYNIKGLEHLQDYGGQAQIVINKHGCYIEVGYYSNQIDCDHVHQLQNLYFALTGTHLTLTPTEK